MRNVEGLLAELHRLSARAETEACLDHHLEQWTTAAARILRAGRCTFHWGQRHADAALPPGMHSEVGGAVLHSRIRHQDRLIAVVQVSEPLDRTHFDQDDLHLLQIVSVCIGESLRIAQLQGLLRSRFAQMALSQAGSGAQEPVLGGLAHPAAIARILAKSFHREMTRAGFGPRQVIGVATQLISELNASLRRHSRRLSAPDSLA